ncbi:MAG: hypothetical protein OXD45_15780 [Rhodobacteraceae bacterium]|nr:hypothetical protein [Paracoccaceae bacterium]
MEPGDVAEFKRGTPVARKDVVERDVPVGAGGREARMFPQWVQPGGEGGGRRIGSACRFR